MRIRKLQWDNWVICSGSCKRCGRCRRLYRCDEADVGGSRACMQYVVRPESRLVKQLIVRVIAQVIKRRCIRWTVSKGVERGWSLSRFVDARTPWRNHAMHWLRTWDERRQSRDKRAVVPHRLVRDSATLAVRSTRRVAGHADWLDGETYI